MLSLGEILHELEFSVFIPESTISQYNGIWDKHEDFQPLYRLCACPQLLCIVVHNMVVSHGQYHPDMGRNTSLDQSYNILWVSPQRGLTVLKRPNTPDMYMQKIMKKDFTQLSMIMSENHHIPREVKGL